ncbi:MAG: cytoplasmic protein [Rickettsiales bacterium]|nr:cytoplasmic protein [Rickettsiales bacterium]|tara:strand:+ start:314 stop:853 length:540 start_codon:yes stop_codon:yes gene_type:complete
MSGPLMPKSTAVWLIDNTGLTFQQIAKFCELHILEVQGIADGEVAVGIQGKNPILSGELTQDDIDKCEKDSSLSLNIIKNEIPLSSNSKKKKKSFTPASRRQLIPDAISWLLKYYPDLSDSQIIKLVGTTKNTINAIKNREHWNMQNISPRDPVLLSLCKQSSLSEAIAIAKAKKEKIK